MDNVIANAFAGPSGCGFRADLCVRPLNAYSTNARTPPRFQGSPLLHFYYHAIY